MHTEHPIRTKAGKVFSTILNVLEHTRYSRVHLAPHLGAERMLEIRRVH